MSEDFEPTRFKCVRCTWQAPEGLSLFDTREAIHEHLIEHELIPPPKTMSLEEAIVETRHLLTLIRPSLRQGAAVNMLIRHAERRDPEV